MIINNKLRTLFVLALYIGFTIAIYAIVCHFLKIEFQDIHYNRQIKKFPTEKQNVSLKHILT